MSKAVTLPICKLHTEQQNSPEFKQTYLLISDNNYH